LKKAGTVAAVASLAAAAALGVSEVLKRRRDA
jgi:hypothetical protein